MTGYSMSPQPLYHSRDAQAAFQLRYSWSAWTNSGHVDKTTLDKVCRQTAPRWEADGLRLLEAACTDDLIQMVFSTKVDVAPVKLATRAKGRLQHELRAAGTPFEFSRKLAVRSVGENTTDDVEQYIAKQVSRSSYFDSRWKEFLNELIVIDPSVNLSQPTATLSGRYWYNLHVVLVVADRQAIHDRATLRSIRDTVLRVAEKKGHRIAALSVMPDHLHIALRGVVEVSPEVIALAFQNNVAYALGQKAIWQPGYYVGTFSEYDMNAIRRRVRGE